LLKPVVNARFLSLSLLLLIPALLALLSAAGVRAGEIVLYDETMGDRPQDQPWFAYFYDFLGRSDPGTSVVAGGVAMDSTSSLGDSAGFFNHGISISLFPPSYSWIMKNPAFPALDPSDGFRLGFELEIRDEDHGNSDRAGFSAILLGQDLRGIELGFWEDSVWAQSGPAFTRAEQTDFNTTIGSILYELTILGLDYMLSADGVDILSGTTRDYSPASPFPDPYDVPNMLFLGDNTGSAGADFTLGRVTLVTGPFAPVENDPVDSVPLPAVWMLVALGLPWLPRASRRPAAIDLDSGRILAARCKQLE
jgi:hypothetical protein